MATYDFNINASMSTMSAGISQFNFDMDFSASMATMSAGVSKTTHHAIAAASSTWSGSLSFLHVLMSNFTASMATMSATTTRLTQKFIRASLPQMYSNDAHTTSLILPTASMSTMSALVRRTTQKALTSSLSTMSAAASGVKAIIASISASMATFAAVLKNPFIRNAWSSYGLECDGLTAVDATSVPVSLSNFTMIVVARAKTLAPDLATVVGSITGSDINGYSIEVGHNGYLNFRANMGSSQLVLTTNDPVLRQNGWFWAAMTFDAGTLTGYVNLLPALTGSYGSFSTPTTNSAGMIYGAPSYQYDTIVSQGSFFGRILPKSFFFNQQMVTSPARTTVGFDGTIAYSLIYDRALASYELSSIYNYLKNTLLARSINLP